MIPRHRGDFASLGPVTQPRPFSHVFHVLPRIVVSRQF
jgi:hypothetical protein